MTKISNILLIGIGPHAKRIYIPWLMANKERANLVAAVELKSSQADVISYFDSLKIKTPELLLVEPFNSDELPSETKAQLQKLMKEKSINAVIIASEPSAHLPYMLWAMSNKLHLLVDKPITTRAAAAYSSRAAKLIFDDFKLLQSDYAKALKSKPDLICSVNVQRRFDPKFDFVRKILKDVTQKTGCPVTAINSTSADGQWRLPDEIIDIDYHGFNYGYGKASHSGYHIFDLINQFIECGIPLEKKPDKVEIFSTSVKPKDFFAQLSLEDYKKIFKDKIDFKRSRADLKLATQNFGELDIFSHMVFKNNDDVICVAQTNLLHTSSSERSWIKPNPDLYKGNGRVKQELHHIQQGPLLSVMVHSYQQPTQSSASLVDKDNDSFTVQIHRNSKLIGGKPYELISAKDILNETTGQNQILESKSIVLKEFFDFIDGKIERQSLRSDLLTHRNSTSLMSGVYLSQIPDHPKPHIIDLAY